MITNSQFLETVYGSLADGRCGWYVAFRGDPNKVGADSWGGAVWLGTPNQALMIDKRLDDNLYYSVGRLAMRDGKMPRRSKQFFDGLAVLLADDADPTNLNGLPSFIIETSPGKNQIGVLLDQEDPATQDPQLIDAVMQAMADAALISADKSGNNAVRLARLPNATNGKGGAQHQVALRTWHPEKRYTLEDALGIFGLDLDAVQSRAQRLERQAPRETSSDAENGELIRRIQSGESYHDPLMKLSAKLVASGASGGAVVNLLRGIMDANGDRSERWKARYDEIPRMVQGAERFRPEPLAPITINLGDSQQPAKAPAELAPMSWGALAQISPEPPDWCLDGWLPARTTTLLSANGGVGKSNLSLQLAASLALGKPFLGTELDSGKVLLLSAEDEGRTVHFRLANICADLGVNLSVLEDRLVAFDLTQADCVLWQEGAPTAKMQWLADQANLFTPRVIIIDNASDVFNANENDRAEVRGFMRALNAIALHSNAAILLLAHVDKASVRFGAGQDSNTTFSGSTAWNNSARSRWAMTRDADRLVVLRHEKCNFGPLQPEMRLEFDPAAKVFRKAGTVPGISCDRVLRNSQRDAILKILAAALKAGQKLSMAATANNNAFRVVSASKGFPRVQRGEFFAILYDMQREGLLEEIEYTNGRKKFKTLALTEYGREQSAPSWET